MFNQTHKQTQQQEAISNIIEILNKLPADQKLVALKEVNTFINAQANSQENTLIKKQLESEKEIYRINAGWFDLDLFAEYCPYFK